MVWERWELEVEIDHQPAGWGTIDEGVCGAKREGREDTG